MIYTTTVICIGAALGAVMNVMFNIQSIGFYWVLGLATGALSCLEWVKR